MLPDHYQVICLLYDPLYDTIIAKYDSFSNQISLQHKGDIFEAGAGDGAVVIGNDLADDFLFDILKFHDALFYAVAGYEPDHLDVPGLADAVRAVGCLIFRGNVPPGIQVDHSVRTGEIQGKRQMLRVFLQRIPTGFL